MDGMSSTTALPMAPTFWHPMPAEIGKAIIDVMSEVRGIEKRGENTFHRFKFMTIGDLMIELQPAMAKAGLFVLQSEYSAEEKNGALMVTYAFGLGHSSGVIWSCPLLQTGMATLLNSKGGVDDKARNKCHTAARKYFLISLFQIPAVDEGDERLHDGDADAAPAAPPTNARTARAATKASESGRASSKGAASETDEARRADFKAIREAVRKAATRDDVEDAWAGSEEALQRVKAHSQAAYDMLVQDYNAAMEARDQ